MFKIKTAHKLELLSKETMRLLGSTEQDIAKDENGETVPKVETVDVALMHATFSIRIINKHQKYYLRLYPINNLGN